MGFDLSGILDARHGEGSTLHARYLNRQTPRVLHAIGFDKVYERADGSYLYDRDGQRYLDFLSGFGVFALGHNHPVVRKALHDMLDRDLADLVQFDCALLPGILAEQLVARTPGMDRVYFSNSGSGWPQEQAFLPRPPRPNSSFQPDTSPVRLNVSRPGCARHQRTSSGDSSPIRRPALTIG